MTARMHIRTFVFALLSACAGLGLYAGVARAEFETPFSVTIAGSSTTPHAEMDTSGSMHFLWHREGVGVQTVKRTAEGGYGAVYNLAAKENGHDLAVDGAGNAHFVVGIPDSGVYAWRRTPAGTFGSAISMAGGSTHEPRVAAGPAGAVFAWVHITPQGGVVEAQRVALDGTRGPVTAISSPGPVGEPEVAIDEAGNVVVVWTRPFSVGSFAETRRWNADGELGEIKLLTTAGGAVFAPQVTFDSAGTALYAVTRSGALQLRRMAPDGTLSTVQDLRMRPSDLAYSPRIAPSVDGGAQVVWRAASAEDGNVIETRHRFPNGLLSEVQILGSYDSALPPTPDVAFDDKGNAHHVWLTSKDGKSVVVGRARATSGALGPLHELSWVNSNATEPELSSGGSARPIAAWIREMDPTTGTVQAALSTPPVVGAGGASGSGGSGGATQPPLDVLPPALSGLSMSPGKLRFGRPGRVDYALSESARLSLRIARRGAGRRVGGRCVRTTRRNRSLERCDLFVRARLVASGQTGRNRLAFSGRVGGRCLRPGRYVLVGVATDLAGNRSAPARAQFRIVRPRR